MTISYCKHKGCPNRETVPGAFRASRGFCTKHAPLPPLRKARKKLRTHETHMGVCVHCNGEATEITSGEACPARANRDTPSLLRASDGVDAGAYTVSEPLTVAMVRERVGGGFGNWGIAESEAACLALYRDVLRTVAADRGPLGDLARAALEAEKE